MILALDISLYTGWAAGRGGDVAFGSRDFSSRNHDYAVVGRRFHEWVADLITEHEPTVLVIERPFFAPGLTQASRRLLSGMVWEAHRVAEIREVKREEYSPSTIKKHITGNGRAGKDDVMRAVQALGHKISNDHEADAVAMLLCHENRGK